MIAINFSCIIHLLIIFITGSILKHFFGNMHDSLIAFEEREAHQNQKNELASNEYTVDINNIIMQMNALEHTVKEQIQYVSSIHTTTDIPVNDKLQTNMNVICLSTEEKKNLWIECKESCKDFKK